MTLRTRDHALPLRPFDYRSSQARALAAKAMPGNALPDDLRLFALTFAGGFLFMTVFLA